MARTPVSEDLDMATFLKCPASGCKRFEATTPSGGYTAGVLYKVQDTWAIPFATYAAAATAVMIYAAERALVTKKTGTGESIAEGDRVYVNSTTKAVSKTKGSGDECVGVCTKSATATATQVEIELDGFRAPDLT